MNKIKELYSQNTSFYILITIAAVVLLVGTIISIAILTSTIINEKLIDYEFCLDDSCVQFFISKTNSAFLVLSATGSVIAGIITLGGIVLALLSYQNSVQTSALTNHLSHMSIFSSYVHNEIEKRSSLSKSCIDTLKWYNYIYNDSRLGRTDISEKYINFIQSINDLIEKSNNLYIGETTKQYEYKIHQGLMIELMLNLGIELHRLPRLDFNEVEDQVLDLVHTINRSFCTTMKEINFLERKYK